MKYTLLAALLAMASVANAQEDTVDKGAPMSEVRLGNSCDEKHPTATDEHGSWYLMCENDAIVLGDNTDEFYSQGLRLGYDFGTGKSPGFIDAQAHALCKLAKVLDFGAGSGERRWVSGVYLGQNIFTPGDITIAALIPDDRPYAGYLYLGERFVMKTEIDAKRANYHAFDFQVGIVGPKAQGEWAQREFHELIDSDAPMGWDNQLPDEWHVFGSYRFAHLRTLLGPSSPIEVDVLPSYELGVGTLQVYAEPAFTLRIGRALGEPPQGNIGQRLPMGVMADVRADVMEKSAGPPRDCLPRGWLGLEECYLYGRISGRAVAHNVFVDGSYSRSSHSVDKESFYRDWAVGFRLRWPSFEVDYEYIRRGREFSPIPATARNRQGEHEYSSLNFQCREGAGWICPAFFGLLLGAIASQ